MDFNVNIFISMMVGGFILSLLSICLLYFNLSDDQKAYLDKAGGENDKSAADSLDKSLSLYQTVIVFLFKITSFGAVIGFISTSAYLLKELFA